jgi:hypothetical protein
MRNRTTYLLLVALAAAAAAVLVASPASAVFGLVRVSSTTIANSADKTAVAFCPAGTVILGGGGFITGTDDGSVHIDQLEPIPVANQFRVRGREYPPGTPANWSVTATAICAPLASVPGLFYAQATSVFVAGPQVVDASCPTGRRALSSGARINGSDGSVILDAAHPLNAGLTITRARAQVAPGGLPPIWTVTAFTVCSLVTTVLVEVATTIDSTTPKTVTATCPAGLLVHGGGFLIRNGNGEVVLTRMRIMPNSIRFRADEATNYLDNWQLRGYAICAP